MANNTGVDATTVKEFCHLCLWVRRVWRSRRLVFDDNPQAVDCKYSSAPYFLNMMATVFQEYSLQRIVMLHDPAEQAGKANLTIAYIVARGQWDTGVRKQLEDLKVKLDAFAGNLRQVRNKLLSHSDLNTVTGGKGNLGAFDEGADTDYFRSLQEFVNIIHDKMVGGIFPLDVAMDDNDALAFARMIHEDCERRKGILARLATGRVP